jgi:hypothetical protein
MRADDLLCSPNAHTRSVVSLDRRCSSKRALGGQSALPPRKMRKTEELYSSKRAVRGQSPSILTEKEARRVPGNRLRSNRGVGRVKKDASGWAGENEPTAATGPCTHLKSQQASIWLSGTGNRNLEDHLKGRSDHALPYRRASARAWSERPFSQIW